MKYLKDFTSGLKDFLRFDKNISPLKIFSLNIEFGKSHHNAKENSLILFPYKPNTLCCGIAALISFKGKQVAKSELLSLSDSADIAPLQEMLVSIKSRILENFIDKIDKKDSIEESYLGGETLLDNLLYHVRLLKTDSLFFEVFSNIEKEKQLDIMGKDISSVIEKEVSDITPRMADMDALDVEIALKRIEKLKDIFWSITREILENITRIRQLAVTGCTPVRCNHSENITGECNPVICTHISQNQVLNFKRINAVLNSIDRLEVRGRDSAGISLLFTLTDAQFESFRQELGRSGLDEQLKQRTNKTVLTNNCITINNGSGNCTEITEKYVSISIVYKYAAEIGSLGDNVAFIRTQIRNDQILQILTGFSAAFSTISAHTRWASVGDITQANCHPVDNEPTDTLVKKSGIIHVSLNGDIDNYPELKKEYESRFDAIHSDITTDTKIIPLQIELHLKQGHPIEEAFRLAVNDFHGSHAISMHTDLAPGKIFLAQKGSGQAIFTGIAPNHYITASELYGLVEETQDFIKLNGEKKGQIVILDQNSDGGVEGMRSIAYDGSPIEIKKENIQHSQITSRDIDRQNFPHYFLKEISEAPLSVTKTLQNKWKISSDTGLYNMNLSSSVIPEHIETELKNGLIKKIYFIGQGTAGIAAQGCADLLRYYLTDQNREKMVKDGYNSALQPAVDAHNFDIRAMKSSELSGFFIIGDDDANESMKNHLVIAISQSGTTTDTNRTVDMVRARGARTLAIVNRRDSDLTFKTEGVLYTSSGRDIEMSVASTKAFYSQLTAGALLGLHIASITGAISQRTLTDELNELNTLPDKMRKVLDMKEKIKKSAFRLAISRNYWATVGSGSNKTSADEIRIKLSELCYKTISSDFVEDKKHIDLSSEPLIIICAAGTRESVLKDIIKDTAIFHAHKAAPIVITDEGEDRFDNYAEDVFRVPKVKEHFAPILNTLVGHLWGYYAALSINEGSQFIYNHQRDIKELINEYKSMGRDVYEVILEKNFREKMALFYNDFSKRRREKRFPAAMGIDNASNITLLLKYLSGRLQVGDFEIDFAKKGTPANMLDEFFKNMAEAVNTMARPVDAIKHQAKTVTVGTSRISDRVEPFDFTEKLEGLVFDEIAANGLSVSQITNKNVVVIKNLQEIIDSIKGAMLYKISGLNLLGEPTSQTKIEVVKKTGITASEVSRVETEHQLKGTKNIIVREGNVYLGKGRKDGRSILVIPVLSSSPSSSVIEYLLSIHVAFKDSNKVSLLNKIKALGGKYTRIKDIILETDVVKWDDTLLDLVDIETLFGDSGEKIAEAIMNRKKNSIV
ncbi:MAG: SIS domain-containing protein [Desulfamplus sp.]|nr:SIS domain-containing protein [Desulfamplus sp.]